MKLPDGTIIPTALRASKIDASHGNSKILKFSYLKIATIISVRYIDSSDKSGIQSSQSVDKKGSLQDAYETVYDVRVDESSARPVIINGCRALKPFYGVNNYFEVIHESSKTSSTFTQESPVPGIGMFSQSADTLVGSRCVVLFIEGQPTAPVIVGFLTHPARKSKITKDKEQHLEFEFQGLKVSVDKDGAFTMLAQGPLAPIPAVPPAPVPETDLRLDPVNGPFSIEIDKKFNFNMYDVIGQTISITHDSPAAGIIKIGNGDDFISFEKASMGGTVSLTSSKALNIVAQESTFESSKSLDITSPAFTLTAETSAELTVGDLKIDASKNTELTCPKIKVEASTSAEFTIGDLKIEASTGAALKAKQLKVESDTTFELKCKTMKLTGGSGELLDLLTKIVEGIGKATVASPLGPCAAISASPQWATDVLQSLTKLKSLMG